MSDSDDSNGSFSCAVGSLIIDIDARIDGPRLTSQKMNSKSGADSKKPDKNSADFRTNPKNNNVVDNEGVKIKQNKNSNTVSENGGGIIDSNKVKNPAQKGPFNGTGGSNLRATAPTSRGSPPPNHPKQNSAAAHSKSAKNRSTEHQRQLQTTTKNKTTEVLNDNKKKIKLESATEKKTTNTTTSATTTTTAGSATAQNSTAATVAAAATSTTTTSGKKGKVVDDVAVTTTATSTKSDDAPNKKPATKDAETITEPEILAPCDSGTEVHLSGIIWHETDGMLVVNVTWRNRSYIGTLLDSSRHDWAPPRLGVDGETEGENKGRGGGRRGGGRKQPIKHNRHSRPDQTTSTPVSGRKNKREPEPSSDTDNGKPGPKKPRTTNGRAATPVNDQNQAEKTDKAEGDGAAAQPIYSCHFKDCQKKFKKQEAMQYHIDDHLKKIAEAEKEKKKKEKKEQDSSKGDKSDNEINAALGLAALGQLSDQKDGAAGPPSLTKGRPQSTENPPSVNPPPPPLLQQQPKGGSGPNLPPMPVLTPKPGLMTGNGAPSPGPRRPNQSSPILGENGDVIEVPIDTSAAVTTSTGASIVASVVQSDPNVPISVPTAQTASPVASNMSPSQQGPAEIPPKLERRPTSPFHPVKPETESPTRARVSPSAYSDISDPGDEIPLPPQNSKTKEEKIQKVEEMKSLAYYPNYKKYELANSSLQGHLLINRDEKKDEPRKEDSKIERKISESDKSDSRVSSLTRPKTHQSEKNAVRPTATIQPEPRKPEVKTPQSKPTIVGKEKVPVSSPAHMPQGLQHMYQYNSEYLRYPQGLPGLPGYIPTTVPHYGGAVPFGLSLPQQTFTQVQKHRNEQKQGLSRDPGRPGSPLKQHSVHHPHMTYTTPGLMQHPSYGYGLHPSTPKK